MLYEFQYDLQPYMVEIEEVIVIPGGHQVFQTEYPESDCNNYFFMNACQTIRLEEI
jgi:hypothetical protein